MSRISRTPGLSAFSLPTPALSRAPSGSPGSSNAPSPAPTANPRAPLYATHGSALRESHLSALQTQLSVFRSLLHNFALQHADRIRADSSFRGEFVRMCRAVGVDASAGWFDSSNSSSGGGGGGEAGRERRNAEIAVRVVEVCRGRRRVDGGLTPLSTVVENVRTGAGRGSPMGLSTLAASAGSAAAAAGSMSEQSYLQQQLLPLLGAEIPDVGPEDIRKAIASLAPLGSGFSLVELPGGKETLVRSVPGALSNDQAVVLECVQVLGWVTCALLEDNLNWARGRAETVCVDLVAGGFVWVDEQGEGGIAEKEYWGTAGLGGWEE